MSYYHYNYNSPPTEEPDYTNYITGSGGCFLGSALVRTSDGYKRIDRITLKDTIVGYDVQGNTLYGAVTEVLKHDIRKVEYFLQFELKNGDISPLVTNNHAIYDDNSSKHELAEKFNEEDSCFRDIYGKTQLIDSITHVPTNELSDKYVYNLIIQPLHTYYVKYENSDNFFCVHNGGGGKDGGNKVEEAPNTLSSDAFLHVLEVISEGEILGIVNGAQGVRLNQVQLEDANGVSNFPGSTVQFRNGLPSQAFISGFEEVAAIFVSNNEVLQGVPVTTTVVNLTTTAVVVTLLLPEGLKKFNLDTGGLEGNILDYEIRVNGAQVVLGQLDDKSVTPYEFSHRITRPSGTSGVWSFVVNRLSPDDNTSNEFSKLVVSRWVELNQPTPIPTYADSALVGADIPARSTGNKIPVRTYDTMGVIIDVPTNFDPLLRTYTGVWDGTFKKAWTDDTAWWLYQFIVHPRFGYQRFFNFPLKVNKWDFHAASVFNNQLIPDGQGGMAVRYTFNTIVSVRKQAWQVLQAIASNMDAIVTTNSLNEITIIQDRPDDPTTRKIITNAGVNGGIFTYTSVSSTEITTSYDIAYNDKNERFLPAIEHVEDASLIAKYGLNVKPILAYGVVDTFRANYYGKRHLRAGITQTEVISFQLNLSIIDIQVGDIVDIIDNDAITNDNTVFLAGKIISNVANVLTLDIAVTPVELVPGETWTFGTNTPDLSGIYEEQVVIPAITPFTTITIPALPAGNYVNREFYFYKTGFIEPKPFRITKITEKQIGEYDVQGLLFDEQKWAVTEQGLNLPAPVFVGTAPDRLNPVTGIQVIEDNLNDNDDKTNLIRITWDYNPKHAYFSLIIRRNGGQVYFTIDKYHKTFLELENIPTGTYDIIITATGQLGAITNPTTKRYIYALGRSPLLKVREFVIKGSGAPVPNPISFIFNVPDPTFIWKFDDDSDDTEAKLSHYIVKSQSMTDFSSDGFPLIFNTYRIEFFNDPNDLVNYRNGEFKYIYQDILKDLTTPNREFELSISAVDYTGRESIPCIQRFKNPAPSLPQGWALWRVATFTTELISANVGDVVDLLISAGDDANFIPTRESIVWRVPAKQTYNRASFVDPSISDRYVRSAYSDNYNEDDLIWSDSVLLPRDNNPPTNVPQNVVATETLKEHGFRDITVTWDIYLQGDFHAEVIVLYLSPDHFSVPISDNIYATIDVNLVSSGTFTFTDQFMGDTLRVGVAAGRQGIDGLVIGQVNSPVPQALLCKYTPGTLTINAQTFNYWDNPINNVKVVIDPTISQQPSVPANTPDPNVGINLPTSTIANPTDLCAIELDIDGNPVGSVNCSVFALNPPTNLDFTLI